MRVAKRKHISKEDYEQRIKARIKHHKEEIKRYKKMLKSVDKDYNS